MARVELIRPIGVPPEHVFAFFVPQRMPYWYGPEMQSCFEVQGGAADFSVGLKVRISGQLGRQAVSLTAVVTAFAYARLLEWRFADAFGVRGLERWELERVPGRSANNLAHNSRGDSPGRFTRCDSTFAIRAASTKCPDGSGA